jgi:hypothetical protein
VGDGPAGAKEAPLKVAPGAVKNKISFPANLLHLLILPRRNADYNFRREAALSPWQRKPIPQNASSRSA